jgi:hypothetical protein
MFYNKLKYKLKYNIKFNFNDETNIYKKSINIKFVQGFFIGSFLFKYNYFFKKIINMQIYKKKFIFIKLYSLYKFLIKSLIKIIYLFKIKIINLNKIKLYKLNNLFILYKLYKNYIKNSIKNKVKNIFIKLYKDLKYLNKNLNNSSILNFLYKVKYKKNKILNIKKMLR